MEALFGTGVDYQLEQARYRERQRRALQRMNTMQMQAMGNSTVVQIQHQNSSAELKPSGAQLEMLAVPANPNDEPAPAFTAEEEKIRAALPPHWTMKKTAGGRIYYECQTQGKKPICQSEPPSAIASFFTSNFMQSIMGVIRMLLDFYKFMMACLMVIFVPQRCTCGDETTPTEWCTAEDIQKQTYHTCSLDENVTDTEGFNTFVLYWNFISLAIVFIHYIVVYKREMWMIEYLDVSPDDPPTNLPSILPQFPEVEADLDNYNKFLFGTAICSCVLNLANIVLSAIVVLYEFTEGYRTITVFITQFLLLINVLNSAVQTAWAGVKHQMAISCALQEWVSFNVIDAIYLRKRASLKLASTGQSAATLPSMGASAPASSASTDVQSQPAVPAMQPTFNP